MLGLTFPMLVKASDDTAKEETRVTECGNVMKELTNAVNGIPSNLLNKSECVIVLPSVKKAGFIVGASYGRRVMTCRSRANFDGSWSAPIMMQSTGGSFGLQAGGRANAGIAAGPVGRDGAGKPSGQPHQDAVTPCSKGCAPTSS